MFPPHHSRPSRIVCTQYTFAGKPLERPPGAKVYHYYRGGVLLKGLPEERAAALAQYIIERSATVRSAAKEFGVSKSTVHKEVTK